MPIIEDVVFAETYKDGDGNEKTRWNNIGVIIEYKNKKGDTKRALKLNMLPLAPGNEHFYSLFEHKDRDQRGGDPMSQARNEYNNRDNQDGGGIDQSRDNTPSDEDMDKPIDLSEIPF